MEEANQAQTRTSSLEILIPYSHFLEHDLESRGLYFTSFLGFVLVLRYLRMSFIVLAGGLNFSIRGDEFVFV